MRLASGIAIPAAENGLIEDQVRNLKIGFCPVGVRVLNK